MSTRLPIAPSLDLLSASLTQALQHALAFHQARPVHAQSASRACVWRTRVPEPPRLTPHTVPTRDHLQLAAVHSPPHHYTPPCPGTLQRHRQSTFGGTLASAHSL